MSTPRYPGKLPTSGPTKSYRLYPREALLVNLWRLAENTTPMRHIFLEAMEPSPPDERGYGGVTQVFWQAARAVEPAPAYADAHGGQTLGLFDHTVGAVASYYLKLLVDKKG